MTYHACRLMLVCQNDLEDYFVSIKGSVWNIFQDYLIYRGDFP